MGAISHLWNMQVTQFKSNFMKFQLSSRGLYVSGLKLVESYNSNVCSYLRHTQIINIVMLERFCSLLCIQIFRVRGPYLNSNIYEDKI